MPAEKAILSKLVERKFVTLIQEGPEGAVQVRDIEAAYMTSS